MGWDLHVQAFHEGQAAERDFEPVRRLLAPMVQGGTDGSFAIVAQGTIEFGLYGWPQPGEAFTHLMVEKPSGNWATLDLIVEMARLADMVIMPEGGTACLTDPAQRRHLPAEFETDWTIHVVRSGAELLAACT